MVYNKFDGDNRSAARFFYVAKSSRSERNKGLDSFGIVTIFGAWDKEDRIARLLVDTAPSPPRVTAEFIVESRSGTAWSTLLFGSAFMDQFQTVCRSTTSTETSSTTASKILSALAHCITSGSIPGVSFAPMDGGNPAANAESSDTLTLITSERTASALGVDPAALPTPLKISVSAGANIHSTVKPIALMRYLVRLVTPPGGTVLDPFTGSGTTGIAAKLEGFNFIGCEREVEYVDIARARIAAWEPEEPDTTPQLALF